MFNRTSEYANITKILKMMDHNRIDQAVLLFPGGERPATPGGWTEACEVYNSAVAAVVKKSGGRFIGAGILPVDNPLQMPQELRRMNDLGLKFICLLSSYQGVHLDDKRFLPIYDFARSHGVPVYVHPQTSFVLPTDFADDVLIESAISPVFDMAISVSKMITSGVFLKYEDVRFIFGHAGTMMALLQNDIDEDYAYFRRHQKIKDIFMRPSQHLKNVFWETGGCTSVFGFQILVNLLDPERILFGTNYPKSTKIPEMRAALEQAIVDKSLLDLILGGNILKIM
jgi:predicted TIM-barrel fold metal-dependent hydrolase